MLVVRYFAEILSALLEENVYFPGFSLLFSRFLVLLTFFKKCDFLKYFSIFFFKKVVKIVLE